MHTKLATLIDANAAFLRYLDTSRWIWQPENAPSTSDVEAALAAHVLRRELPLPDSFLAGLLSSHASNAPVFGALLSVLLALVLVVLAPVDPRR